MAVEVSIPQLGVTMEEGVLLEWLAEDGAPVRSGDVLYTLETDKAENEIESPADGTLRIKATEGETYAVGTVIAEIV